MMSKWFRLKPKAVELRNKGLSIRIIEKRLKIPRSTLSGWFKGIKLTETQMENLRIQYKLGLIKARIKAVKWHNLQKQNRLDQAKSQASNTLSNLNTQDINLIELALSMLYLGEGTKKLYTSIGNSNPLILKFFLNSIYRLYDVKPSDIKCDLHLRYDQDPRKLTEYWSEVLTLPKSCFFANRDIRTKGSKTYSNYKGVCLVRCCKIAILRRLIFLSEEFCNKIVSQV